jgi:hypothetical protein
VGYAFERDPLVFVPGEHVIWLYRSSGRRRYPIAAQVVQMGQLRARIRSRRADGTYVLRWVKPSNLRRLEPGEPAYPYPSDNE